MIKVSVVMPAFNEAAGIGGLLYDVQQVLAQHYQANEFEIIVVDDGSTDETFRIAEGAGATVLRHKRNVGNGGAVKTGLRHAKGETIVTMDADGQHRPSDIPRLLSQINGVDMVVGARSRRSQATLGRHVANRVYNTLASYMCDRPINDLTSGFRAIKAEVARQFIYLLPNTFSYPTTITMAVVRSGYSLTYLPIESPSRVGKSKIKPLQDGWRFLMIIIKVATLFSPLKVFIPVSTLMFLTGVLYGLFKIFVLGLNYGPTSAMLMTVAVNIFMTGLVSEQIAQMRFDRTSR